MKRIKQIISNCLNLGRGELSPNNLKNNFNQINSSEGMQLMKDTLETCCSHCRFTIYKALYSDPILEASRSKFRKKNKTVFIPSIFREVTLPEQQGLLLELIVNAKDKGANSLDLQKTGLLGVAKQIKKLKLKGFDIETKLLDIIDSEGRVRKRVAHYIFKGMEDMYA